MILQKPTKIGSRYFYIPFRAVLEVIKLPEFASYHKCKILTGHYSDQFNDCDWKFLRFEDWVELKNQEKPL